MTTDQRSKAAAGLEKAIDGAERALFVLAGTARRTSQEFQKLCNMLDELDALQADLQLNGRLAAA